MNGATEATLAELLSVAEQMNVNISRLVSSINSGNSTSSSNSTSTAGSALGALSKVALPLTIAFGALNSAVSLVGSAFRAVWDPIAKTGKNLFDFAEKAASGTAKLSDFYAAFKDLPLFIGDIASLFSRIIAYSERLLTSYQNLTKVGATFGGNLFQMAQQAARAYMTVDEFSKVITENSQIFANMGSTVQSGINRFVEIQRTMMGPGSPYSKQILGLGFTFSEAAQSTATFIKMQGSAANLAKMSNQEIMRGAFESAKELDRLSIVTGKHRDVLQKEIDEVQGEEAYQQFLASIADPEVRKAITTGVAEMTALGGKEVGKRAKQFMMGMETPMNEAQTHGEIMSQGMMSNQLRMLKDAAFSRASVEQMGVLSRQAIFTVGQSANNTARTMGQTFNVLSAMGDPMVTSLNQAMAFTRNTKDLNSKEYLAKVEQEKKMKGNAAALAQAELSIKQFGLTIFGMVNRIIAPIANQLIVFGNAVSSIIATFVGSQGFQDTLNDVMGWFKTTFADLEKAYKSGGINSLMETLFKRVGEGLDNVWKKFEPIWTNSIKPKLISMFEAFLDFIKPYFMRAMNIISDKMEEWIYGLPGAKEAFGLKNPVIRKYQRAYEQDEAMRAEQASALALAEKEGSGVSQERIKEMRNKLTEYEIRAQFTKKVYEQAEKTGKEVEVSFLNSLRESMHERLPFHPAIIMDRMLYYLQTMPGNQVPARRHSGTFGVTGNWFEKENATVDVQAGESVMTNEQLTNLTRGATENNLTTTMNQLNNTQDKLARILERIEDNTRRGYVAINNLNQDAFNIG